MATIDSPAVPEGTGLGRLCRRLYDGLPLFYLVACIPFGLVYCFLAPPMLVPDEWAHFFRTVQISYGDVIGEKPEGMKPGGQIPQSLTTFMADPRFTKRLASKKAADGATDSQAEPAAISRLRLEEETTFHICPFVRYPPSSYLFGAAAVRLGRMLQLDAVSIFYLARLFTLVSAAIMGWLALTWISSGRLFVFLSLSMPATLSLFGSCSQDAALIAFTAVVVGFLQRFLANPAPPLPVHLQRRLFPGAIAAAAILGAVAAGRPPYLPLAGIVPLSYLTATRRWRDAAILTFVSLAVPFWWLWATRGLGSGNEFDSNHAGQIQFILSHPGESLATFFRSVWHYVWSTSFLRHLVAERPNGGPLPLWLYRAAAIGYLATFARDAWFSPNAATRRTKLLVLVLVGGAFFALHLAGYVYFTPVGADRVRGIQGRYLVPLMLALTFAIGRGGGRTAAANGRPIAADLCDLASFAIAFGVVAVANVASAINIMRVFYYP